jgi:hypothetical protein
MATSEDFPKPEIDSVTNQLTWDYAVVLMMPNERTTQRPRFHATKGRRSRRRMNLTCDELI